MSVVSDFLGMTFRVVYEEDVEPHVSVLYWDWSGPELSAKYGLESRRIIEGWLPKLGMGEIDMWVEEHLAELEKAWGDSRVGKRPAPISPLD